MLYVWLNSSDDCQINLFSPGHSFQKQSAILCVWLKSKSGLLEQQKQTQKAKVKKGRHKNTCYCEIVAWGVGMWKGVAVVLAYSSVQPSADVGFIIKDNKSQQ